jgi:hypothetical protein
MRQSASPERVGAARARRIAQAGEACFEFTPQETGRPGEKGFGHSCLRGFMRHRVTYHSCLHGINAPSGDPEPTPISAVGFAEKAVDCGGCGENPRRLSKSHDAIGPGAGGAPAEIAAGVVMLAPSLSGAPISAAPMPRECPGLLGIAKRRLATMPRPGRVRYVPASARFVTAAAGSNLGLVPSGLGPRSWRRGLRRFRLD